MRVRPSYLRIRYVGAAGDIELPSRANGLQARQGVQDFRRGMRELSSDFNLFPSNSFVSFLDGRKSEESPSLAAWLRAFSVISSSLRAKLSTSRNHSVGKVSAFADVFSDRSHPLTGCQRYCGRRRLLRHRPLPQCLSRRGSFIHASQALRPEKRGSPLPMGRTGTDFITLPLHCVRTRPAVKRGKASPCVL